jgi:hypothetical protein
VGAKDTKDTTLGGLGVFLVGVAKTKELSQSLLVFCGNVDWGQVTTSVQAHEIFSIKTVSLTALATFSRNERGSDNLAVKTISGEHPLKNKSRAGSFVASSHGVVLGEASEEPSNLHQIPREPHYFGALRVSFENRSGNRIEMNIETDPGILRHGWTPPKNKLSVSITHVALAQVR